MQTFDLKQKKEQKASGPETPETGKSIKGPAHEHLSGLQDLANQSSQVKGFAQAQQVARPAPSAIHSPEKKQQQKEGESEEKEEGLPMEMKKERLQEAKSFVEKVIEKSESQDEVTAQFPVIRERFGLKKLEWTKEESPKIFMKINPEAYISLRDSKLMLGPWNADHVMTPGEVEFKPGSVSLNGSSYTVGMEMEARKLGPHHPQGGPPTASALKDLTSFLPTNPELKAPEKYIKGHLLNDNLGGPGTTNNLFPITAAANKQHEAVVERHVKHWVNDLGWWVYYKVKVDNVHVTPTPDGEMIHADFVCNAAPLDTSGKRITSRKISKTIPSKLHHIADTGVGADPDLPPGTVTGTIDKAEGFDKEKVKLSTSHGDPSLPAPVDSDITALAQEIFKPLRTHFDRKEILAFLEPQLVDSGFSENLDYFTQMIYDPYLDIGHTTLETGPWNTMVNKINLNKPRILEWLDEIKAEIEKREFRERLDLFGTSPRLTKRVITRKMRMYSLGKLSAAPSKKKKKKKKGAAKLGLPAGTHSSKVSAKAAAKFAKKKKKGSVSTSSGV